MCQYDNTKVMAFSEFFQIIFYFVQIIFVFLRNWAKNAEYYYDMAYFGIN